MELRRFEAPTLQEALDTVKRELGPEAVIVQTRKHTKAFGLMSGQSFEVTAAQPEPSAEWSHLNLQLIQLRKELQELRVRQEQMTQSAEGIECFEPEAREVFHDLVLQGVDRYLAKSAILKSIESGENRALKERVRDSLLASVQLESIFTQNCLAFVGRSGVGKTSTLAKISAQAQERQLRVGLISIQGESVSSSYEQLGAIAKVLRIPFRSVRTAEDLELSVRDFQTLNLVLIDACDCPSLQKNLKAVPQIKPILVMSAHTRDTEAYSLASQYSELQLAGTIFTKIDESKLNGLILNFSQRMNLPIFGLCAGQKIPGDFQEASKEVLGNLFWGQHSLLWKNLPAAKSIESR